MAVYGEWVRDLMESYFAGKTIKAMLVTSSYTQAAAHTYRSDITSEVVATGYTAGGVDVTASVSFTLTADFEVQMFANASFGTMDASTVNGIVFYISTGTASTDRLIVADIFGPVEVGTGVDFAYTCNSGGLIVAAFDDDIEEV